MFWQGLPFDGLIEYMDSYRHMSVVVMLNSVELLVDLMRFPGQLIPFSDKAMFIPHISATEDEPADYDSCDSPLEPNCPFFGFSDRTNNERYDYMTRVDDFHLKSNLQNNIC